MSDPDSIHHSSTGQGESFSSVQIPRRWAKPLSIGLGSLAVFFAGWEITERTLLSDMSTGLLHAVHEVKVVLASLVAASIVGWLVIHDSPPLLATTTERDWSRAIWPNRREIVTQNVLWFIRMRWVAVAVAATVAVVVTNVIQLLAASLLWPLLITVATLAAMNLVYLRLVKSDRWWRFNLPIQVMVDLVLLAVLLHFSGGVENPLSVLMVLHVILGGVLLSRRWCYTVAAAGGLLYAALVWMEGVGWIRHYSLQIYPFADGDTFRLAGHVVYTTSRVALHIAMLWLVALFVGALGERARNDQRQLRVVADRALAERRLLDRALETTGTALRVVDQNMRASFVNSRWEQWLAGAGSRDCPVIEEVDGSNCQARLAFSDGAARVKEVSIPSFPTNGPETAPCGERVIRLTTAPLRGRSGTIEQVVELAQDVTEQKRRRDQLIRAGQLAAVGQLAGQVAHEVNNPIAIISAKARLLLSDHRQELSDKVAEELAKVVDLSDRVAGISQGLLSYCRPSPATRSPLDIRPLVLKALSLMEQRADTLGVTIEQRLDDPLPRVRANAGEIEQVFLNIMLNAMDAMRSGGTLTVTGSSAATTLADGTPAVAVCVGDTGIGIDPGVRAQIFDPFFSTKEQGKGTGLGLSICLGIVRSHGGEIDVEPCQRGGTCVTVRLPCDIEHDQRNPPG